MKKILLIAICIFGVAGCASSGNKALAKEDAQSVQSKIQKGTTTKADVNKAFGKPTSVTSSSDGKETWVYSLSNVKIHGSSFIPFYGLFKNGSDINVKQLIVTYNGDVVENYTMNETNTTTQSGLVQ